jgi:hypothetical protein
MWIVCLIALAVILGWGQWLRTHDEMAQMHDKLAGLEQSLVETRDKLDATSRQRESTESRELRAPLAVPLLVPSSAPTQKIPAEPPQQVQTSAPEITSEEIREHIETVFYAEAESPDWSINARRQAHEKLTKLLPVSANLRALDCRSSMCRIETEHANDEDAREFILGAFVSRETALWNAGFFSTEIGMTANDRHIRLSYMARENQELPRHPLMR